MTRPARLAFICWAVAAGLFIGILFLTLGTPSSSEGAGEAIGRVVAMTGLPALFSWLIARKKVPPWGAVRFVVLYIAMFVGLAIVTAVGRVRAADAPLPFAVSFEEGWKVTPLDRDLGMSQRAVWAYTGGDIVAMMELTCAWLTHEPDLAQEFDRTIANVASMAQAKGLDFEHTPPRLKRRGRYEWLEIEGSITKAGEEAVRQHVGVTLGERCFFGATLAGSPIAYELKQAAFERTLASLHEVPID